jgi:hypothetical protein
MRPPMFGSETVTNTICIVGTVAYVLDGRGQHGAARMPFSKHVIDPKHIEVMRLAFQKVCDALSLKCSPDDPQTDLIVLKIIELTKAGEDDPVRICASVLIELTKQPGSGK